MFGAPVTLNFEGEDNFKTCFGGCISIAVFIFIVVYSFILFNTMIKLQETVINTNILVDSLAENSQKYDLNQSNFILGLYSENDSIAALYNSSYLIIHAFQVTSTTDQVGATQNRTEVRRNLTLGLWNDRFNPILGESIAFNVGTRSVIWINESDISIGGNFASLEYNYIEWNIYKWTGHIVWENETAIDDAIKSITVGMAITDFYFDINDYENPVKVNLADDFEYFPASGVTKDVLVKVRNNKARDYHQPFSLSSSKDHNFFSIGSIKNDFYDQGDDKKVMKIKIDLDSKYTNVERRVYTLGDLFGQIGGMKEMLSLIAILLVSSFNNKLYTSTLISSLYLVESKDKLTNSIGDEHKSDLNVLHTELHDESKISDMHSKRMNTLNSISPKDRSINSMNRSEK